jgi:hypothetical protein
LPERVNGLVDLTVSNREKNGFGGAFAKRVSFGKADPKAAPIEAGQPLVKWICD